MNNLIIAIDEAQVKIEQAFGQCRTTQDAAALWATLQETVDFSARLNLKRLDELAASDQGGYLYASVSAASSSV